MGMKFTSNDKIHNLSVYHIHIISNYLHTKAKTTIKHIKYVFSGKCNLMINRRTNRKMTNIVDFVNFELYI